MTAIGMLILLGGAVVAWAGFSNQTLSSVIGYGIFGREDLRREREPIVRSFAAQTGEGGVVTASGWTRPLPGPTGSPFGACRDGCSRRHQGIDIGGTNCQTVIRAARAGIVTFAGNRGNYGKVIYIEHGDGYQTRYAHNCANRVGIGSPVRQGQEIATVGYTGNASSSWPHLHFEIRRAGKPIDPDTLVGV